MKIDFSSRHNILFHSREDDSLRPMDEPYYLSSYIADGVWMIRSEGCNTYLVEGDDEAVVIDTGYAAGDLRAFCQCLTTRPVNRVINTHDHFDHSALNGLFDAAIMSEKTAPLATKPFPSFEGITFPTDYEKVIVHDGDVIDIGNRRLTFIETPDHAVGSIMILDERSGILFTGDEVSRFGKDLNGYVETVYRQFLRVEEYRSKFSFVCGGHEGKKDAGIIDSITENLAHILDGAEGTIPEPRNFRLPGPKEDGKGNIIWERDMPHPGDIPAKDHSGEEWNRVMDYAGCRVQYNLKKIHEES